MSEAVVWLDAETKAMEAPDDHRAELRLWLRLLTCTTLIENEVRKRLREEFDITLPRFDLLAQLDRAPDGLVLGEVSKRLMVSAGNVTAIVDKLLATDFITRTPLPEDRRVQVIRMTPRGRRQFQAMAKAHGDWIGDFLKRLTPEDAERLMGLLGEVKASVREAIPS